MDFALSTKQLQFKEEVAAFVEGWDKEQIKACEEASEFPHQLYRELSKRGWAGVMVPPEFGGLGMGAVEMAIITQEFGLIGFSGLALTLHGQRTLLKLGTPEQQAKYLPQLTRGELLSAIVVSERDVGSSLKQMKTRAVKEDGHYIINGHKHSITLGAEAGLFIVFTITDNGLTTILVDTDTPGIHVEKLDAVGWRLEPHYDVTFTDCRVPETQLLGEEGKGLQTFFATFNITRLCNASHLIGIARSAIRDSIEYATKRSVGDNKVADFQGIQWMIADLAVKLEVANLVLFKAAWMEDAGLKHEKETAMAKLLAVELVDAAANKAFTIVGGQPTTYGTDHRVLLDSLERGKGRYLATALVDDSVSEGEMERLAKAGVRSARFNFLSSLGLDWNRAKFERTVARIAEFGWITVVHGTAEELLERQEMLRKVPTQVVIDHLVHWDLARGYAGMRTFDFICDLLHQGNFWIKLSNADRISLEGPPYDDTVGLVQAFIAAAPDRAIWATDWPHILYKGKMPNDAELIELLFRFAPDASVREKILVDNPAKLYRF